MKRDVINGFEWHIYSEDEIEQARNAEQGGDSRVLVASTCCDCGGYIERHTSESRPVHRDGAHLQGFNSQD